MIKNTHWFSKLDGNLLRKTHVYVSISTTETEIKKLVIKNVELAFTAKK